MTRDELKSKFPNASEEFIRRNATPAPNLDRVVAAAAPKKRLRQQQGDGLNATEREFSKFLVSEWPFAHAHLVQSVTLKLANGVRYTPDNIIVLGGLVLYAFEVKGFMRDDAAVKLKIAARVYPWIKFHLVTKKKKKDGGGWLIQEVLP